MYPEVGKLYEIRIPRAAGYEFLGEQRTVAKCAFELREGYWEFQVPMPHEGDEGRGVGFSVHENDIIREQ